MTGHERFSDSVFSASVWTGDVLGGVGGDSAVGDMVGREGGTEGDAKGGMDGRARGLLVTTGFFVGETGS